MTSEEALTKLRACAEAGLTLAGRDWREAEEAEAIVAAALKRKELGRGWLEEDGYREWRIRRYKSYKTCVHVVVYEEEPR